MIPREIVLQSIITNGVHTTKVIRDYACTCVSDYVDDVILASYGPGLYNTDTGETTSPLKN